MNEMRNDDALWNALERVEAIPSQKIRLAIFNEAISMRNKGYSEDAIVEFICDVLDGCPVLKPKNPEEANDV